MTTTFLFDIGRVLIGWHPNKLMDEVLKNTPTKDVPKLRKAFIKWDNNWDASNLHKGIQAAKKKHPEHADIIQAYQDNWLSHGLGQPIEGTIQIMKQLKADGHRLIAASNFASDTFELARKEGRMDFVDLFDELHVSGFINIIKPDPAFFTSLLEKFDVDPKDALFTDDLQDNIDAAKSCGIEGILFTSPEAFKAELVKHNLLTCDS